MTDKEPVVIEGYKIGQIWKDKRSRVETIFVIHELYYKKYENGYEPLRVIGMLIDKDGFIDKSRDLDSRSVKNMFPYLMFDVRDPEYDFEDK